MKAAALLIFMLSNQGRWLSGTEGRIVFSWTADAAATPCELVWELKLGDTRLGEGHTSIGLRESPTVKIACPEVRAQVVLQWSWRLVRKEDGQEIARGTEKLVAYPANLLAGWPTLLNDKKIVVIGPANGIAALLDQAKVKYLRLDDVSKLQMTVADIVIVSPDVLQDKLFEQGPLLGLLQTGTAVAVFRQTHIESLLGFDIVSRALPDKLMWPVEDPLFKGLDADDLRSWEREWGQVESKDIQALRVPENEITSAVVTWPAKPAGNAATLSNPSAAMDSLIVSRSGGKNGPGRLVLCQMPLQNWKTDPRSQIFFGNVLDVLISPPSPRPQPLAVPTTVRPRSTITISPGDSQ